MEQKKNNGIADIEQRIIVAPKGGPTDGIEAHIQGMFTKFTEPSKANTTFTNEVCKCKILASLSDGTVSISMKDAKGIMVSVRMDELAYVIRKAIEVAKEIQSKKEQKK